MHRLLEPLTAALDQTGPAIAPVPAVSATISQDYVASVLAAVRPEDRAAPLEDDEIDLVMPTSGSTGRPRGVLLTAASLEAGTKAANGSAPSQVQWIAALPVTSMGGMNVVIRSLATGRPPLVLDSIGGAGPFVAHTFAQAVHMAAARAHDIRVSLVPPQLARLLGDDEGIEALQACSLILVGGAATRPSLLESARELGITVTTTYGATETAGGCIFDGRPIPGVTVGVVDDLIRIGGTVVARGYRCDPEASAAHFRDGRFVSADLGIIDSTGMLQVVGRADDVVIVNGVNVSPVAIEHVMSDLPDVAAAAVVTVHPPGADPVLAAFIEPRDGAGNTVDSARVAVLNRLGKAAVPAVMRTVERLPHLPHGKVDRRLLEQWASDDVSGDR